MSNRAGIAKSKALALSAIAIVTAIVVRQMWLGNYYAELNESSPHALPAVTTQYDWDASQRKLERIGAALQLYRKHVGVKPVAGRMTLNDAGLPSDDVMSVLSKPGFDWSIDADAFRRKTGAPQEKATYAGDFFLPIESRRIMLDAIGPIGSPSPIYFVGTDAKATRATGISTASRSTSFHNGFSPAARTCPCSLITARMFSEVRTLRNLPHLRSFCGLAAKSTASPVQTF